jgi:hypothetical protein
MNGIILYADDDVLNINAPEYGLFKKFSDSEEYSILPITNIPDLSKTIQSISTFRALLLDWSFKRPKNDDDLPDINDNPFDLLKSQKIYSLVYVYSREDIPEDIKTQLRKIYGANKIFFEQKAGNFDINTEYKKIISGISAFEAENQHMEIPFIWSHAINQAVQTIFRELEQADVNWIKEIRETAKNDGGNPTSEVIDVFHNLLNESLIQNQDLRQSLDNYECQKAGTNAAKLYRRIFYSHLTADAPIMTGDIFKFANEVYGIVVTPECEINSRIKEGTLEFLIFKATDFGLHLQKQHSYNLTEYNKQSDKRKASLRKVFNNESASSHLLPSFPFEEDIYNKTACINFKNGFAIKSEQEYKTARTNFKLNAPYIHQLRQRFVSFFGRYGVPAIPDSLRITNL